MRTLVLIGLGNPGALRHTRHSVALSAIKQLSKVLRIKMHSSRMGLGSVLSSLGVESSTMAKVGVGYMRTVPQPLKVSSPSSPSDGDDNPPALEGKSFPAASTETLMEFLRGKDRRPADTVGGCDELLEGSQRAWLLPEEGNGIRCDPENMERCWGSVVYHQGKGKLVSLQSHGRLRRELAMRSSLMEVSPLLQFGNILKKSTSSSDSTIPDISTFLKGSDAALSRYGFPVPERKFVDVSKSSKVASALAEERGPDDLLAASEKAGEAGKKKEKKKGKGAKKAPAPPATVVDLSAGGPVVNLSTGGSPSGEPLETQGAGSGATSQERGEPSSTVSNPKDLLPADLTRVILIVPTIPMNLNGFSLKCALKWLKKRHGVDPPPPGNVVVLHDELDLKAGAVKWKLGGSAAGHNGIKSCISHCMGTSEFPRISMGIGRPERGSVTPVAKYVLEEADKSETNSIRHTSAPVFSGILAEHAWEDAETRRLPYPLDKILPMITTAVSNWSSPAPPVVTKKRRKKTSGSE